MAEYPQSALIVSGAIPRRSQDESFASSLKVTALSLFAAFIAACVLSFIYKTCIADFITQFRLSGLSSSTFNSGFGRTGEVPPAVPTRPECEVSIPVRESGVLLVLSGAASVGGG
ncbi:movement protein [Digitaria ciliaris striate mosaic virus]|uniref:Movement protein n=1 Tax=Digitaria ciliaris striate mosaic virus TaxID=1196237 RepID=J7FGV5_9GEMI|nr:movement protein [Digitaria ciliaris striate mosaic virus]AFN80559.1 movement protein [Digitaria ciliaris striate mosaic virus]